MSFVSPHDLQHFFDLCSWGRLAARLEISGARNNWIAAARYTDDLLLVSFWICGDCLGVITKDIYCGAILGLMSKKQMSRALGSL